MHMKQKENLFIVLFIISMLSSPFVCYSHDVKLKSNSLGEACVAMPAVITSKAGEFIQKDKDSLGMMITTCISERLGREGLTWQQAPDELNDRIMRNFKPKLIDNNDPVDSISYAASELAGSLKVKSLVVIYSYIDKNHAGAMAASSILGNIGEGAGSITAIFFSNGLADPDDDIYLYCSVYDVQSKKAVMAKRHSISKKGKSSNAAFKKEVQDFINSLF
jgi:hypothetical protein